MTIDLRIVFAVLALVFNVRASDLVTVEEVEATANADLAVLRTTLARPFDVALSSATVVLL